VRGPKDRTGVGPGRLWRRACSEDGERRRERKPRRGSAIARRTAILTGGGATDPAPRSHQVAATRRPAQPPPAPAPKAQDLHLETRPPLIRLIKGCLVSCGRRCGTRGRRVPQVSRRQSDARPLRRCAAEACLFDRRAKRPLQLAHRCCRWPLPGAVALDPYTEGEVALVSSLRPRWIPIGPRWWRSVELGPAANGVQELLLVVEGEETKDLASTSGSLSEVSLSSVADGSAPRRLLIAAPVRLHCCRLRTRRGLSPTETGDGAPCAWKVSAARRAAWACAISSGLGCSSRFSERHPLGGRDRGSSQSWSRR
jgi:hypothetical protein